MSKPIISLLVVAAIGATAATSLPIPATAAELLSPKIFRAHHHHVHWCNPCGCLRVRYLYHRELRSTYGSGFDPRNFDQTEPYYYFGRVRAYPQYWVDAGPVQ